MVAPNLLPAAAQAQAARRMGEHNRQRQWAQALVVFATLPLSSVSNAACYVEAIRAHGGLGQPARALDTFAALESSAAKVSLVSYTAAIRACATASHWPVALSLLQDARDGGLEPDTIACNAALSACERGGQWEEALLLLQEMDLSEASPPDRVSFNTAIAALSRGGQWRKALELLDEMPRVVAPPHNTPDAHSFGAAISACERGGQPDAALGLLHRMQADAAVAPNIIVYNAAIRACATPDHWPIALSLLDDARADGLRLTRNSFNCALAACEAGGQWEEALLLVEGVQSETGSRPDGISFHTAIAACRRAAVAAAATRKGKDAGKEAGARRARREGRRAARAALGLLQRMRASRVRTSLIGYTTAMSALSAAGYVRAALCVYGLLAAAHPPDAKSVGTALAACEKAARWAQGLWLLEGLRDSGAAGAAVAEDHAEWTARARRRLGEGTGLEGARHGGSGSQRADGGGGGEGGGRVAAVVGRKRRAAADGDGASSAGHVQRTAGRARAKQRAAAGEVESA